MYPNLYYVFKDWFGVSWEWTKVLNTFGLFVALAFLTAAYTLSLELKRKEKKGLLKYREETIVVGEGVTPFELLVNAAIGFVAGYKLLGLIFSRPVDVTPQNYLFSAEGHWLGGLIGAALLAGLKYYDKSKTKLAKPERRSVRIWPHDRVGDIVIYALVFGILGAKLFDAFEHWDTFMSDPLAYLLSQGGLAFYGGLIVAAAGVSWYARKKNIKLRHLVDAIAPGLMLAYAVGRIGCQVAGDGDWGIFNSAYTSDDRGKMAVAAPGDFEKAKQQHSNYLLKGSVGDSATGRLEQVTDRIYPSLAEVPAKSFTAPSFLPTWLAAYTYPQNVNNDGIVMPGVTEDHNRVLPMPVYPTPLYETIIGLFFFGILWFLRKRLKTPMVLFGIYLVLNGIERFFIEHIRVNFHYNFLGMQLSQSQIISLFMMLAGIITIIIAKRKWDGENA